MKVLPLLLFLILPNYTCLITITYDFRFIPLLQINIVVVIFIIILLLLKLLLLLLLNHVIIIIIIILNFNDSIGQNQFNVIIFA